MKTLSFDNRQASCMVAIACHEACGDQSSLAISINEGFDAGLTISQVKEALSHLYAYTGFPRSLNALGTLSQVLNQRDADSLATDEGREATPLPKDFNALKQGTAVQTQLTGQPFNYDFCLSEDYYLKAHLFGDIFGRDNLTFADRELLTVSALSALEGTYPQLKSHVQGARNMGVTDEQLQLIADALESVGMAAAAQRCRVAIGLLSGEPELPVSPSVWPLGDSNSAYAQYFVGQSYVAPLEGGLVNVSFEPGCRNNWHIHHHAVQVLVCVSGRGWYQEWGSAPVELRPGVTIAVPEGVKHWHGAAADSWMQHLTYHTDVKAGNSTEWLEPVDDQHYASLR